MEEGIVARVTPKGFGFIKRSENQRDIFFHSKELVDVLYDEIKEGDKVSFEIGDSPKGSVALKVRKIG